MNQALRQKLETLPSSPGVYFHKSQSGEVIYVGKAARLRSRVRQYFQESRARDSKTMALVAEIIDTDWIETESEVDALFLESEMVKRYMPRYNVLLRDDKSQTYVRITMKEEWPTVTFTRNPSDDGADYFGPFYNGFALKKALRYLRKVYPYRTKERRPDESQLEEQIGINPKRSEGSAAYKSDLKKLISYIKGNRKALMREVEHDMKRAAEAHDFEAAARYRNQLVALRELQRRVMFGDREFLDISKDKALSDLVTILGLPSQPRRIEGFDISHMSGRATVASMVVFTNGVSDRAEYRKFKVSEQNNDAGNMYQALSRRLSERNIARWGMPNLILVDGGKAQLMAAVKALSERELAIPVIGIAKRDEEIIVHTERSSVSLQQLEAALPAGVSVIRSGEFATINLHVGQGNLGGHAKNLRGTSTLSPYSDVTKLFQRIRDEAHRFAVAYHTTLKRSQATQSTLESIPGVGAVTRKKLLKTFGSVRGVRQAGHAELAAAVGPKLAAKIIQTVGESAPK